MPSSSFEVPISCCCGTSLTGSTPWEFEIDLLSSTARTRGIRKSPRGEQVPVSSSPTQDQPPLKGRGLRDFEDSLDFDADAERQRSHPHRRARVPSLLTKDLNEEVRAAVDHLRVVGEF